MRISDLGFSYMRMMAIQRAAMKSIKSVNIDVKLKQKHDKDMKTTMFKWTYQSFYFAYPRFKLL